MNYLVVLWLHMDDTPLVSHVPSDALSGRYVLIINLLTQDFQPPFDFWCRKVTHFFINQQRKIAIFFNLWLHFNLMSGVSSKGGEGGRFKHHQ